MGRLYQNIGNERVSQGRLREAAFNLWTTYEMLRAANMPIYSCVTGMYLARIYMYLDEIDKGIRHILSFTLYSSCCFFFFF